MAFPEIRKKIGKFFADREPISLNLKTVIGFNSLTEAEYLRKFPQIYSILAGGLPSWSGETVTAMTALQNSVVWACRGVVAGTMGYLPARVKQDVNGEARDATELPIFKAMKWEPNEEMGSQDFRELLTGHCMFTGGGFAQIVRRSGGGSALQLRQLQPENVCPDREKTGQKRLVYVVKETNSPDKVFTVEAGKAHDIFHLRGPGWDGIRGFDVIAFAKNSIGMAMSADKHASAFFSSGGRGPYVLEMEKPFRPNSSDAKDFRKDWQDRYKDPTEVPILDPGFTYKPIGANMRDAQAIEFRQAIISELCRWFDVMPHLVGDLSRATFSNIEELALQFEKITLSKWLGRWNADFHRCVLTPEEQDKGYYLYHNLDALRRGDFAARMMGYAAALQNGWMNRDEVRKKEDMNVIPDGAGQDYTIQLNMQGLPLDGTAELAKQRQQKKPPMGGN